MIIENKKRDDALLRLLKNASHIKWYEITEGNVVKYISYDKNVVFKTVSSLGKIYKYYLQAFGWEYQEKEYFPAHLHEVIRGSKPIRVKNVNEMETNHNKRKEDKKKRIEEEKLAEEKIKREKAAFEKAEKERFLKENMLDVSLYKHIFLRESISEIEKCESCNRNVREVVRGVNDKVGIIRMLRCKECEVCKDIYIRCPTFFGMDEEITNKMIPDEKSIEMLQLVEKYGIPIRKDGVNAEEISGGLFTSGVGNCPYDRESLQNRKANILILTKKGIENKSITLGICKKCGRHIISLHDYNRLREKGHVICDVYCIEPFMGVRNGLICVRGRCEKIASKDILQNQKNYELFKDRIVKVGFEERINKFVRTSKRECSFDNTELKDIKVSINIIAPNGSILETEFPAVCCTTCGIIYVHESIYRRIRQMGIPQCRFIEAENVYSDEGQRNFDEWKLESKLHLYGYNVSGNVDLTDEQRQCVLYNIIANGFMQRWEVVDHISFLISLNKNKMSYESAIAKWKRDLEYVNSLDLLNLEQMNPSRMIVKKRIGKTK